MSLLPIALGHVDITGELSYGKNVGTPSWNATAGQYEIPILDPSGAPILYYYEDFATVASSDTDLTAVVTSAPPSSSNQDDSSPSYVAWDNGGWWWS
jgi:hypothetical protein